ncbi:MAG: glycosyltransferase family 2 protein [Clostridium celatum]|nr:glycosyltransferase family 2 protein [Clostridium celatum]
MKIDVSVIVPVYNVENYLEGCLKSLENQTYNNFEVIIVNDGSKDKSEEIAKSICERNKNFMYIYQENKGLGGARNTGLKLAKGKYVTFLDSDDKFPSNCIEKMINHAVKNNSDVVLGRPVWEEFGEVRGTYLDSIFKGEYFLKSEDCAYICLVTSQLIKKSIIDKYKIYFPEKVTGEDVEFALNLQKHIKGIHIIPDIAYYRTERDDTINKSITQTFTSKIVEDRLKSIQRLNNISVQSNLGSNKYLKIYQNIDFIQKTIKKMNNNREKLEAISKIKEFSQKVQLPNEMYWLGFYTGKKQFKFMKNEEILRRINSENMGVNYYKNKCIFKVKNLIKGNWI